MDIDLGASSDDGHLNGHYQYQQQQHQPRSDDAADLEPLSSVLRTQNTRHADPTSQAMLSPIEFKPSTITSKTIAQDARDKSARQFDGDGVDWEAMYNELSSPALPGAVTAADGMAYERFWVNFLHRHVQMFSVVSAGPDVEHPAVYVSPYTATSSDSIALIRRDKFDFGLLAFTPEYLGGGEALGRIPFVSPYFRISVERPHATKHFYYLLPLDQTYGPRRIIELDSAHASQIPADKMDDISTLYILENGAGKINANLTLVLDESSMTQKQFESRSFSRRVNLEIFDGRAGGRSTVLHQSLRLYGPPNAAKKANQALQRTASQRLFATWDTLSEDLTHLNDPVRQLIEKRIPWRPCVDEVHRVFLLFNRHSEFRVHRPLHTLYKLGLDELRVILVSNNPHAEPTTEIYAIGKGQRQLVVHISRQRGQLLDTNRYVVDHIAVKGVAGSDVVSKLEAHYIAVGMFYELASTQTTGAVRSIRDSSKSPAMALFPTIKRPRPDDSPASDKKAPLHLHTAKLFRMLYTNSRGVDFDGIEILANAGAFLPVYEQTSPSFDVIARQLHHIYTKIVESDNASESDSLDAAVPIEVNIGAWARSIKSRVRQALSSPAPAPVPGAVVLAPVAGGEAERIESAMRAMLQSMQATRSPDDNVVLFTLYEDLVESASAQPTKPDRASLAPGAYIPARMMTSVEDVHLPIEARQVQIDQSIRAMRDNLPHDYFDVEIMRGPVLANAEPTKHQEIITNAQQKYARELAVRMFCDSVVVPLLVHTSPQLIEWLARALDAIFPLRVRETAAQYQSLDMHSRLEYDMHGVDAPSVERKQQSPLSHQVTRYLYLVIESARDRSKELTGRYHPSYYESNFLPKVRKMLDLLMAVNGTVSSKSKRQTKQPSSSAAVDGKSLDIAFGYYVFCAITSRLVDMVNPLYAQNATSQALTALLSLAKMSEDDKGIRIHETEVVAEAAVVERTLFGATEERSRRFFLSMFSALFNSAITSWPAIVMAANPGAVPADKLRYYASIPEKIFKDRLVRVHSLHSYVALCIAWLGYSLEQSYYYTPKLLNEGSELKFARSRMRQAAIDVLANVVKYRPSQVVFDYLRSGRSAIQLNATHWNVVFYDGMPKENRTLLMMSRPIDAPSVLLRMLGGYLENGDKLGASRAFERFHIFPYVQCITLNPLPRAKQVLFDRTFSRLFSYGDLLRVYQLLLDACDDSDDNRQRQQQSIARLASPAMNFPVSADSMRQQRAMIESVPLIIAPSTRYCTMRADPKTGLEYEQVGEATRDQQKTAIRLFLADLEAVTTQEIALLEASSEQDAIQTLADVRHVMYPPSLAPLPAVVIPDKPEKKRTEIIEEKIQAAKQHTLTEKIQASMDSRLAVGAKLIQEATGNVRVYVPKIKNSLDDSELVALNAAMSSTSVSTASDTAMLQRRVQEISLLIESSVVHSNGRSSAKQKPPPPSLIQDKIESIQFY